MDVKRKAKPARYKLRKASHNFTKKGGVYSWWRLKVAIAGGLGIFPILALLAMPFFSAFSYPLNMMGYVDIGFTKATVVEGSFVGFPFSFFMTIHPISIVGNNVYRIYLIGLALDIIVAILAVYFVLTLFSDFNFGNKRNRRAAIIATVFTTMLLFSTGVLATTIAIGEQTVQNDVVGILSSGQYVRETFSTTSAFTSKSVTCKYVTGWGQSNFGTYTIGLTLPGGSTNSWTDTMFSWNGQLGWRTQTGTMSCSAGSCEERITLNTDQPAMDYLWIGVDNPCSYSGDLYVNAGGGEIHYTTKDMSFGAYYDLTYTLTMAMAGTGGQSTSPSVGTHTYNPGTQVQISATAQSGYHFTNWVGTGAGSYTGTTNSWNIQMNNDITETAYFAQDGPTTYTLTMTMGTGGASTTPSVGTHTYNAGTQVTISAIAASGYSFSSWTGSGSGSYTGSTNSVTITMNGNIQETANFIVNPIEYTVTVSAYPSNGGTETGAGQYAAGAQVTCTATANSGYTFSSWTGDFTGSSTTLQFTMPGNSVSETANYNAIVTHTLTMYSDPTDGGSTDPGSGTHTYNHGDSVTCHAYPSSHWHFTHWSGDYGGNDNPYVTVMTSDKALTANFDEDTYALTVTTNGQGTVYKNPFPPYHYNDDVELTATASSGWSFDHWSGDMSGNENPGHIFMTDNKAVTAVFAQNQLPPVINKFTVNTTSISKVGNITFSWATSRADVVHLFLNDVDQGEFNATVGAKSVQIAGTTTASITATGPGGDTGSTVITITVGQGQIVNGGFNYAWLLLLIIPIGIILFDRWLKKKPPFGKGENDYVTINIGDALRKATGKKPKGKTPKTSTAPKTRSEKAKAIVQGAGKATKNAVGKIFSILKGPKPPSGPSGGEEGSE